MKVKAPWYQIKEGIKEYPWPCGSFLDRTIDIFDNDVLTLDENGKTYTKHTGACCFGIEIPKEDLVKVNSDIELQFL